MKTGGFTLEDYTMIDACVFWGAAGCYAPLLRQLSFALTALPCSSGEAERNWNEVKQNLVKNRNRLGRARLEKMVFVRRFIRLQRAIAFDNSHAVFSKWIQQLLKDAAKTDDDDVGDPGGNDPDDIEQRLIFEDSIEPGEQGRINGREPGQPRVGLTVLRKDNAAKSWLFEKYYDMHFVDKNPDADEADAPPLADESEWEHRVIKNVAWWRSKGYSVLTSLRGDPDDPLIERYLINSKLHEMIRDSPHNNRTMRSSMNQEPAAAEAATSSEEDSHSETSSDAGENHVNVRHV